MAGGARSRILRRLRDRVDEDVAARPLEVGEPRGAAELLQLALGNVAIALDEGGDDFAPFFVGDTDHGDLIDIRMQRQAALDLDRRDVLAAGDDHVVDAAGDEQVAVGIDVAGVAGKVPALAQRLGVGFGTPPVTFESLVTGERRYDLALLANRSKLGDRPRADANNLDVLVQPRLAGRARLCRGVLIDGKGVDLRAAVMIDEQVWLERLVQLLQQAIGHRGAGETELAHAGDVGPGKRLVMDEVVIERRHQIKIGDLFLLDQRQRLAAVIARQADERAADQRHRQQRADAHGVVERHDAERALPAAVEILRDMGDRCGSLGAVPARHALWPRRRARGVEHDRPGIGTDTRLRVGRAVLDQVRKAGGLTGPGIDGHAQQPACQRRTLHGLGRDVLMEDRAGLGVLDAIIELVGLGAPVDRRDHEARDLAGPVQRRRLPAVLQQRDDVIAGLEAEAVERRHQRGNLVVPLPIGQTKVAVDQGNRIGIARGAGHEAAGEIKHRTSHFWMKRVRRRLRAPPG